MRPEAQDLPPEEKKEPCAGCGGDSECAIWGHRFCYRCAAEYGQKMPTCDDIERKHGKDADVPAVMRAFTARWLLARKARVAA